MNETPIESLRHDPGGANADDVRALAAENERLRAVERAAREVDRFLQDNCLPPLSTTAALTEALDRVW